MQGWGFPLENISEDINSYVLLLFKTLQQDLGGGGKGHIIALPPHVYTKRFMTFGNGQTFLSVSDSKLIKIRYMTLFVKQKSKYSSPIGMPGVLTS